MDINVNKGLTASSEVTEYDCRNATYATATFRLKFVPNKGKGGFSKVLAYATFDDRYERMIEDGDSVKDLAVVCSKNSTIRTLRFEATVRQVQSCRHHHQAPQVSPVAGRGKLFGLLEEGMFIFVSGHNLYSTLEWRTIESNGFFVGKP